MFLDFISFRAISWREINCFLEDLKLHLDPFFSEPGFQNSFLVLSLLLKKSKCKCLLGPGHYGVYEGNGEEIIVLTGQRGHAKWGILTAKVEEINYGCCRFDSLCSYEHRSEPVRSLSVFESGEI